MEKISLKSAEGEQKDVGRGRIRISDNNMKLIGISPGNIVELLAKDKNTGAIVYLLQDQTGGKSSNIIRIDGIIRRNLGIKIGESVNIRKAKTQPATQVKIAPYEKIKIDLSLKQYVKQKIIGYPITKDDMILVQLLGQAHRFIIESTSSNSDYISIITKSTNLTFNEKPVSDIKTENQVFYEDVGGLESVIQKIREMIELPLRYPELFKKFGISPPKGVLLHGPPGTGKTLLAKAVANESEANFVTIQGPEIMSKFYGESEAKLREIFDNAEKNEPSIIFIDEIDAIASKRDEASGEVERRVVAQILSLMDGMNPRGNVTVIGATNRLEALDEALRRPGRFDREIYINVPDQTERLEILQIHTRRMPGIEKVDLQKLSEITHGYVGADVAALAREAAINALREIIHLIDFEAKNYEIPQNIIDQLVIKQSHFLNAMKEIQPTALREVFIERPNVSWDSIGGLNNIKQILLETIEWPLSNKEALNRLGISPPKGILLYGPSGVGKTLIVKAIASNSGVNFISIKGPEMLSKWVGESERKIREIFKKARMASPAIIFFDEIDAITHTRAAARDTQSSVSQSVMSQLLTEMDGLETTQNVIILAATTRPDLIDTALLRSGRFDRILYVKPPEIDERHNILKIHTKKMPLNTDIKLEEIARLTEFFTGADLHALCREAGIIALRENMEATIISLNHFNAALDVVSASLSPEILTFYQNFHLKFKNALWKKELQKQNRFDFT